MRFVAEDSYNDNEEVAVRMTRRDLDELIQVLHQAEVLCDGMRQHEQEFRLHRLRLSRLRMESVPPAPVPPALLSTAPPPPDIIPDRRDTTRYVAASDVVDLTLEKKPRG